MKLETEYTRGSEIPFNPNGGLTLVPLPGFEQIALELKALIEATGGASQSQTPLHRRRCGDPEVQTSTKRGNVRRVG